MLVSPPKIARYLFPDAIWRLPSSPYNKPVVYLTFDDGPTPQITEWVLNLLEQKKIKATFFCVGKNIEKYPELFARTKAGGHTCANHTYEHLNGWRTQKSKYADNVLKCSAYFENRLFRPPYGKVTPAQYAELKKLFRFVFWDIISFDFDSKTTPEQCYNNVVKHARNGSIIVFHDSIKAKKNMEFALPRAIESLKEKGFEFASL